jgi:hypothetical protein
MIIYVETPKESVEKLLELMLVQQDSRMQDKCVKSQFTQHSVYSQMGKLG